jgi:hypothetical protein
MWHRHHHRRGENSKLHLLLPLPSKTNIQMTPREPVSFCLLSAESGS